MSYKVIKMFDDLRDAITTKSGTLYHRYEVGDAYPREGVKPDAARIEELAGFDNAQGQPLIVADSVAKATEKLEAVKKEAKKDV